MKLPTLTVTALLICSASCTSPDAGPSVDKPAQPASPAQPNTTDSPPAATVLPLTTTRDADAIPSDPFAINRAWIEDDTLKIQVTYGGGSKDHGFKLCWARVVMESYPAQTTVTLKHDAKGDMAKALIREVLSFDVTEIGKPTYITIQTDHGKDTRVLYGENKLPR